MRAAANLGGIGGASSASIDDSCVGGAAIAATPWAVASQIPTPAIATPTVIFGTNELGHYDHPGLRLALSLAGNLHRVVQSISRSAHYRNEQQQRCKRRIRRARAVGRAPGAVGHLSAQKVSAVPRKLRGAQAHSFSYLSEARSDAAREHPQRRSRHTRNDQINLAINWTPPAISSISPLWPVQSNSFPGLQLRCFMATHRLKPPHNKLNTFTACESPTST
jgi:hypothetical protein